MTATRQRHRKHTYSFRPRKQIQRLLVVDACQRLRAIAPLGQFEYVGFGGYEFVDFDLFRRRLGVGRMTSYEWDEEPERYEFNRPFADVELKFGPAGQYLPFLDRATLRIVWLDYVDRLNALVIQDVAAAASRLAPGSLLLVTYNSAPATPANRRRQQLADDVGEERLPNGVTDRSLARWGLAAAQRDILTATLSESLRQRNEGAVFEQIFNFNYADRAQMSTIGGMVVTPGMRQGFAAAAFDELDQVRRGASAVHIGAPALTAKEAIHLNRQLPLAAGAVLECPGLAEEELSAYQRFHRWYPPVPAAI